MIRTDAGKVMIADKLSCGEIGQELDIAPAILYNLSRAPEGDAAGRSPFTAKQGLRRKE